MGDYGRMARGMAAAVLVLAAGGATMAQDGIRMIDGSLTYRERMALPDDALAVIEARDGRGRLLGEATLGTRGAQVPVPFQIAVPSDIEAQLRAAFVIDGRPAWYVADIALPAGTEPLDLGEIVLGRFIPMGFASTFRCGDREVAVGFFAQNAVIEAEGERMVLEPAPSDSGQRFAAPDDPGTWVETRGEAVTVSLGGEALPACAIVPPDAPRPYRARGNEPGWALSIADGRATFTADNGARTVEAALPEAAFEDRTFLYRMPEAALELRLEPRLCRDSMTGMPHPETATVMLDGSVFTGCGGDPLELLTGAEWAVTAIAGKDVASGAQVTLTVGDDGAVGGSASCNRYATTLTIGGERISLGQIAATRKMCEEPLMEEESAFFSALASAMRFDIGADGALLLYGPDAPDPVIAARR